MSERDLIGLGDPIVPDAGNPGYDVRHYDWELNVDPRSNHLTASASMQAVATSDRDRVTLDFAGPSIASVLFDGEPALFARSRGKLVIEAPVVRSQRFEISVEYGGTPSQGWISLSGSIRTASLLPGDTSGWVPLNDTPLDPATYTLQIAVPRSLVATASGRLVDTVDGADGRTFVWEVDLPVSEVTFAVGAYRIEKLEGPRGLSIEVALPSQDPSIDLSQFERVPGMLAFLEAHLGPFPLPSLGLTWIEGYGGGDSTPGRINLSESSEVVLVHELAHQWMGGSVGTASTRDAWLREGIPTYIEVLWTEKRQGPKAAQLMIEDFRRQLGVSTRAPLDVTDAADRSDDVTFLRGALTMHALHQQLGQRIFFRALKAFFTTHRGMSASTEDFISTVEQVADRDLDGFFTAWLSREPLPERTG